MTDDRDRIIATIKKLLSMAEHAGSNEHEALLAAKRAEALMRKHNVDYAEAIAAEIKTGKAIETRDVVATAKDNGTPTQATPPWAQQLAVRVGELFDSPVRLVRIETRKGRWETAVRFHGYVHDVEVASWTFDVLVKAVNRVCKAYRLHPNYLQNGRTVMNAYRLGVVHGILSTLSQLIDAKIAEEAVVGSTSTALVLVKRKAIEDKFGEFKYRTAKPASVKDRTAYHDGRVEGKKIEVQQALKDKEELLKLEAAR
jgi:hypothetical protein